MLKSVSIIVLALALSNVLAAPATSSAKINPNLLRSLRSQSTANILVSMGAGVQRVYDAIEAKASMYTTRQQRATAAYEGLNALAAESQTEILEMLRSPRYFALRVQSFWISNQIYIQGADRTLIDLLTTYDAVSRIDEEEIIYLDHPVVVGQVVSGPLEASWGVDKIQAPDAWAFLDGNNGRGAVVGTLDTGARWTHQALRDSYKNGTHAWFDAYSTAAPMPHDGQGHGTHVTGTVAGGFGIGIAPGAKWMACKGLRDDGSGTNAALLACGQFFACPTDYQGNNAKCDEVPDAVSCSWGGAGGNTFFENVVAAWRNAAIIPVFANGNSGELCRTTGSPADSVRVIAVGATDDTDAITSWSSRGPSNAGQDKPDLSAPGALIMSASHTSDTNYVMFSGTSMACPHVAGLVALLRAADPDSTYLRIRNAMINSAEQENLRFSGQVCNFRPDDQFPSYSFGYGRINALRAVQEIQRIKVAEESA